MKIRTIAAVIAAVVTLSQNPAIADVMFAVTPSGKAEAIFDKPLSEAMSSLSSFCMDRGWTVAASTSTQVTCEIQMSMGQSVLGQALLGNSYSTPPRQFVQFNGGQLGRSSRVQVLQWIELQMAFGQTRRTDLDSATAYNNEIGLLLAAGGRLPPGTSFPNHAFMGVEGDMIPVEGKLGLNIKSVVVGSPAEKAGLQPGDIAFQVAGKRWKDDDGYMEATAKAAAGATYQVQIIRSGQRQTLFVARAFRPAITAPANVEPTVAQTTASAALSPSPSHSVADELRKFVELRDAGVISPAEFEVQKAKLLAR